MRTWNRLLGVLAVLAAATCVVPAARASTSASLTLGQSAGTQAGAYQNLGVNLSFSNTGTDTPKTLALQLPAGLLANTSIDNGNCLTSNLVGNSACEIGSGTVNAEIVPAGLLTLPLAVPVSVGFYLVPPPSSGDLAGIAVYGLGQQIGATGPIDIRPSGSADGVGATITLTLPDALPASSLPAPVSTLLSGLAQLSITSITSTFDALRYPTTCPSTPANLTASVNSYQDATTQPLSAPLPVTGCGSLTYTPSLSTSATRDSADHQVTLATTITEAAATAAPSRSISLAFPNTVVLPNLRALAALCSTPSSSCTQVGSVTALSPLYPNALTGTAYLTGNSSGLQLTLVFPAPFPLTLEGSLNLVANSATFTGLPDIPLSSLKVTLGGGAQGLFLSECVASSGTATAALTDQNGNESRNLAAPITVAGCPSSSGSGSGSSGGSSSSGGSGPSGSGTSSGSGASSSATATSAGPSASVAGTHLLASALRGLAAGHPSLRLRVSVDRHASRIRRLTVALPRGLTLRADARHAGTIAGVAVSGARVRSIRVTRDRLVVTLRTGARRVTVSLGPRALKESASLRAAVRRRRTGHLRLRVSVENTRGATHALSVRVGTLHL